MNSNDTCRLCNARATLQESHIIPKFIIRWLKDSSATGYLRDNTTPNRRVQDGLKLPLLCCTCELLFSRWETEFANKIFYPFNLNRPKKFLYGPWLLKFAVSVSWRSLTYYVDITKEQAAYSGDAIRLFETALTRWGEFLLDQRPHPGIFEQHMMILDSVAGVQNLDNLPPNISRFFVRGTHLNLGISNGHPAFIFTKMGRMALFGFLAIKHPRRWLGTKIHVKTGEIGGNISLPKQVLDYLIDRAEVERIDSSKISSRQRKRIAETLRWNPDRAAASETFQALDCDVRLFGDKAFQEEDTDAVTEGETPKG